MDNEKKLTPEIEAADEAALASAENVAVETEADAPDEIAADENAAVEDDAAAAEDGETPDDELEPARFVAKTVLGAEMQLEASKTLAPKVGNIAGFLGIGLMVALLGVTLWQYFTTFQTDRLLMAGLLVLVIAFFVYSRKTAPKKALKRWESSMQRTYGANQLHLTTEFFEHSLAQSVEESDDFIVEGYSKISELRETEHLLLLRCSARQWFFVAKDGFTVGNADDFKEFIRSHIGDK